MSKNAIYLFIVIVLLSIMSQISADIYLPSLPAIARDLQTSLTQAQLTMTAFITGLTFATLIYGPLSEGLGRKQTVLIGLWISIVGVVVAMFAHSIFMLQLGRFIQGCGLAATASLWRSIFRDSFSGATFVRMGSYMLNFVILSIMVSPFVGGYIQQYFHWRAVFYALGGWTMLVIFFTLFCFKETNLDSHKDKLSLVFMFKAFAELLTHRRFMTFSVISFLTYGGLYAWLTSGSTLIIHHIGKTPVEFGHLMLLSGVSMSLSGFLNTRLIRYFSGLQLVRASLITIVCMGLLMVILYYSIGMTVITIMAPVFIFVICTTLIFINCFRCAFEDVGHVAGYAGSIYAFIQQAGGVVLSAIISHLPETTPLPLAAIFMVTGLMALAVSCFSD